MVKRSVNEIERMYKHELRSQRPRDLSECAVFLGSFCSREGIRRESRHYELLKFHTGMYLAQLEAVENLKNRK